MTRPCSWRPTPGAGERAIRFWEPANYAVVLGASRRLEEDVIIDACRADGVPIVRAVQRRRDSCRGTGRAQCLGVLARLGAAPGFTTVDGAHRYVLDELARCIGPTGPELSVLGLGDLVLEGRKCARQRQRRLKAWFMVHCTILYDFSIERIARYLAIPRRQPEYRRGRGHHEFLRNLGLPRKILRNAIQGDSRARRLAPPRALVPFLP